MEVVSIKLHDVRVGYCVYTRDVNAREQETLVSIVRLLGLRRDFAREARDLELCGDPNIGAKGPQFVSRKYKSRFYLFSFVYSPDLNTLAFVWTVLRKGLSGEDLVSIWMSDADQVRMRG